MAKAIIVILYLCAGYFGGKAFGYGGLLEIFIWPVVVPIAAWIRHKEADVLMEKLDDLRPANLNTLYAVENIICEMPTADVEPVEHGEWISVDERLP